MHEETISIKDPNPRRTLADYLRNEAGLTGTKISCNEGGCPGACTVVLSGPPLEGFRLPAAAVLYERSGGDHSRGIGQSEEGAPCSAEGNCEEERDAVRIVHARHGG
jgi:hypothetical protein